MDNMSFDALARSLTALQPRRSFLNAVAGVAVSSAVGAWRGPDGIEARKKHKRKHKKCKAPNTTCGGTCTALPSDPQNCGRCGQACATGESCANGHCSAGTQCSTGLTRCDGACVNLTTDRANCGACGQGCAAGATCQGGNCLTTSCPSGQHDCGAKGCRQCCADSHCGSFQQCDVATGTCACANHTHTCDDPYVCWSCCNDEHCRAYGRAPEDGFICTMQHACVCQSGSICTKSDQSGYFCADLQNDDENCGECGFNCQNWTCIAGTCTPPEA